MNYPRWVRPALIVLIVASLAQIAYSTFKIANLWGLESVSLALDITTIVGMILVIALTLVLYLAQFKVREGRLTLKILFINMLVENIKIDNILNIVYYTSTNRLYLGYIMDDSSTDILHINIKPKAMDAFVQHMQSLNSKIVYSEESN